MNKSNKILGIQFVRNEKTFLTGRPKKKTLRNEN